MVVQQFDVDGGGVSDRPHGPLGEEFSVGGGGDRIPLVFSLVKLKKKLIIITKLLMMILVLFS